jgi:hypothetical protein
MMGFVLRMQHTHFQPAGHSTAAGISSRQPAGVMHLIIAGLLT